MGFIHFPTVQVEVVCGLVGVVTNLSITYDKGTVQNQLTKNSYLKIDKEETKQEFYYRLRDAMEDTLILGKDNITDDGKVVTEDEDMTPTVKSMVVLDWLDAVGGPPLVEHVHCVYAKELETSTLASLQSRIWKNMTALMRVLG